MDTHIFTCTLNSIFLINNYIQHPSLENHHPNKLLILIIVHQIYKTLHTIHIHKVRGHTRIIGNEVVDTLTNEGTYKDKPATTPNIHIARTTFYWLTTTHDGAIRNSIHSYMKDTGNKNPLQPNTTFHTLKNGYQMAH